MRYNLRAGGQIDGSKFYKKGFGMSRAASSAVVSSRSQRAAREVASNKRFDSSKRGPKAELSGKRLPATRHLRSGKRATDSSGREKRNPGLRLGIAPSFLANPSGASSHVLNSSAGILPALGALHSPPRISTPPRPTPLRSPARVLVGRAGDHPDVYQLLLAVFQGPSREEFHASQDDPTYEPSNRLLVRQGGRLVSHVLLNRRTMNFGPLRLPVDRVAWLATLPEFRSQGYGSLLLEAAGRTTTTRCAAVHKTGENIVENIAATESAPRSRSTDAPAWGTLTTTIPRFFRRSGWAVCGRHCRSRAKARNVLGRYWADPTLRSRPLNIRLWRHVELSALMRIYAQNTTGVFGPLVRSEAYWRWLISRKAFDHIVVAIAGPDKLELDEASAPIVGYAVVRQQRVVELLTDPAHPYAGLQLLARACSDAIERDQQEIELEAPPGDPLHQFIAAADGRFLHHEMEEQEVYMVRRPDMLGVARSLASLWEARLHDSGMSRACELGLLIGDEKYLLTVGRRGTRLVSGRLSRNYIACSSTELTRLALGHSDPAEAAAGGRLTASTQLALESAKVLFPRVPMWQPSWDDLTC